MESDPKVLEEEAYSFLAENKYEEAFRFFKRAARSYQAQSNHKQAALCFSSAASCWSRRSGEETFYNAASSYRIAAKEAEKSRDYEYASLLYRYAAINFERDREYHKFSESFYLSKDCERKFLFYRLFLPRKINTITQSQYESGPKGMLKSIFVFFVLSFSYLIWGYGEKPLRTFFASLGIVTLAGLLYTGGELLSSGMVIKPSFFEAFYFSVITFTTVGFGDIIPVGISKCIVILESLCGVFFMPLFVIGLSRKYLRI